MSDTVLILGAGASKPGGAPVMAEFRTHALSLARAGQLESGNGDLEVLDRAIPHLQRAADKTAVDLHNLESIWGLLEMAETLGTLGPLDQAEIKATSQALQRLITNTLESSLDFPVPNPTYSRALVSLRSKSTGSA